MDIETKYLNEKRSVTKKVSESTIIDTKQLGPQSLQSYRNIEVALKKGRSPEDIQKFVDRLVMVLHKESYEDGYENGFEEAQRKIKNIQKNIQRIANEIQQGNDEMLKGFEGK